MPENGGNANGKITLSWKWLGPTVLVVLIGAVGGWAASMQQRDRQFEESMLGMMNRVSAIESNVAAVSSRLGVLERQMGRIENKVDMILAAPMTRR